MMFYMPKLLVLIASFSIYFEAHAQTLPVNTQASIFKNAGISCLKAPSRINIARDASVDNYLNNVGGQFEKNPRIQSQLRSLLSRFPDHPHLNWQAGWLAYLNNDFSGTIHHLKKSAIQGDPNAAHILAYIALGALDGGDALKPDESTKYMPVDLGIAMQCLKVAYEWGETVEKDRPSIDLQFYYGARYTAAEYLAALYLHDLNYFVEGGPDNVRKNFISNGDLTKVEFNPKRAAEVVKLLQKQNPEQYKVILAAVKAAEMKAIESERRTNEKRVLDEQLRYANSLALPAEKLAALEIKCNGFTTIKGVCWSLSKFEMRSMLASRGFKTHPDNPDNFKDSANASIKIKEESLEFDCAIFKACDLSVQELASLIQRSGLVKGPMGYDSSQTGGLYKDFYSNINNFCGRGHKGEKICIEEITTIFGGLTIKGKLVVLGKGIVGKDISFK
jgi:hypothetical protein